jgi:hypothetical protein
MYEETHPQRTRMANVISTHCLGLDVHRDAEFIKSYVDRELRVVAVFLNLLARVGTMHVRRCDVQDYNRWCVKTEATWMDEWKRWSANVQRSE